MTPSISLADVLNHPHFIDTIVAWILREWPTDGKSAEDVEHRLIGERRRHQLPLVVVAIDAGRPVGYVSVTRLSLPDQPDNDCWVDGLLVESTHRGAGLGTRLLEAAVARAAKLGLTHLAVYTSDVSLYARSGWRPWRPEASTVGHGPIVMRRPITNADR